MALFHLTAGVRSRSRNHSAVASAAYLARTTLHDDRLNRTHDYSAKSKELAFETVIAPLNAPDWAINREQLWNHAEAIERRRDSQIGKSYIIALPAELTIAQNARAITEWAREAFVDKGRAADIAIHRPHRGTKNWHARVTVTERRIVDGEFTPKKDRDNSLLSRKASLTALRRDWAEIANHHLQAHGFNPSLDHRSYRERDIDKLPQIHMGKDANAIERKGGRTRVGTENARRRAWNTARGWGPGSDPKVGTIASPTKQLMRDLSNAVHDLRAEAITLDRHLSRTIDDRSPQLSRSLDRLSWPDRIQIMHANRQLMPMFERIIERNRRHDLGWDRGR